MNSELKEGPMPRLIKISIAMVGGILLIATGCASDREAQPTPMTGPLQAEIVKSREPIQTQITGVTRPIPTQITGTPVVQITGTPTVQLADKDNGQRMGWEYSIIEAGTDLTVVVEQLNQLGKEGWEVV